MHEISLIFHKSESIRFKLTEIQIKEGYVFIRGIQKYEIMNLICFEWKEIY
jgi:hypothetical protein